MITAKQVIKSNKRILNYALWTSFLLVVLLGSSFLLLLALERTYGGDTQALLAAHPRALFLIYLLLGAFVLLSLASVFRSIKLFIGFMAFVFTRKTAWQRDAEDMAKKVATVTNQPLKVDASGNVQPYCQEAVTFRTKGAIELVGPDAVSLKGGMAGTYVRSTGKGGAGTLIVRDWTGAEMELSFTVRV